jgi:hypothetical protein
MRLSTKLLMVCMVFVLSISNLAISFEGVSAMPDRNVQGICNIADVSFPKGCTNAQLKSLTSSSTRAVLKYFKNTLELNCWHKYLVADGITEGLVSIISTGFDNYQMACQPDKELYPYIYRTDGLRSDFKNIYAIEYHPAYEYWLQTCNMADGCANVFEEYKKRQGLIWDKNQNGAEIEAKRLMEIVLKISRDVAAQTKQQQIIAAAKADAKDKAEAEQRKKNEAAANANSANSAANRKAALIAATEKIKASGGCRIGNSNSWTENGYSYNFSEGARICTKGKWSKPIKTSPSGSGSGSNSTKQTLVNKTCDLKATAMSSGWSGQNYSWTIWNNWSDGSKTVASMGSGYANSVPNGC